MAPVMAGMDALLSRVTWGAIRVLLRRDPAEEHQQRRPRSPCSQRPRLWRSSGVQGRAAMTTTVALAPW